jgi:hypothetical protein
VAFKTTDVSIEADESKRRRLEVLMDLVVFAVTTRCYLRKVPVVASDLVGVVDKRRVDRLNDTDHMVLRAGMDLSKRLVKLHEGKVDSPQLNVALEGKLKLVDDLIQTAGGENRRSLKDYSSAFAPTTPTQLFSPTLRDSLLSLQDLNGSRTLPFRSSTPPTFDHFSFFIS